MSLPARRGSEMETQSSRMSAMKGAKSVPGFVEDQDYIRADAERCPGVRKRVFVFGVAFVVHF